MSAMVLLLGCLAGGIVLRRAGKLPNNAPAALNRGAFRRLQPPRGLK